MRPFSKEDVLSALRHVTLPGEAGDIVEADAVKNIQILGDGVDIEVLISNPTLQARKRLEVSIMKAVHDRINPKIVVKVDVQVLPKKDKLPKIRGKKIEGIKNIVAVASGKGGVGKSTIATNMAVTLAGMGFKTGFLDADIYGPSAPIMFDVENERPLAVNVEGRSKMRPVSSYGVKLLSIGFFTKPSQAVIWRGPMASKALNQMIFDVDWGELDFLILDLPPGTGDIHLSILQSLPVTGALVVSTPQKIALADARKGIAMFQQESIDVPVLGLVENMSYFTPKELPDKKYYLFGKEGCKYLAEELKVPFLGEIPINQSVREAADVGRPAALQDKSSAIYGAFSNFTKNLIEQVIERNEYLPPSEIVKITTMKGCNAIKNKL